MTTLQIGLLYGGATIAALFVLVVGLEGSGVRSRVPRHAEIVITPT